MCDISFKEFYPKVGKDYIEAHHLIPMEYQGDFSVSIDVPENIISLCPNCHRAFHNSVVSNQKNLISTGLRSNKNNLYSTGFCCLLIHCDQKNPYSLGLYCNY